MGVNTLCGSCNKCVATAGVSVFMLLNLGILKIVLLIPILSDQYKAGPLEVNLTHIATITIGTTRIQEAITAKIKSNDLFIFTTAAMTVKTYLPSEWANHNHKIYFH